MMDIVETVVGFFADILTKLFEFAPVSGTLGLLFVVIYVPKTESISQFRKDMRDYYFYKYTTKRPLWKKVTYRLMWPLFKLDDLVSAVVANWWSMIQDIGRAGLLFVAFVISGKVTTTAVQLLQQQTAPPAAQADTSKQE